MNTSSSTPSSHRLSERDLAVVQLVARFKQLSSRHIHQLLYEAHTTYTPSNRALRRLTEQKFLERIERRIVGGSRGGSGQYVYQLGRRGFYLYNTGRFQPPRAIGYHTLAIADCYVVLRQLERAGLLQLVGLSTEPDCWTTIAGIELKPDLYVEVAKRGGERVKLWVEMDMGTEAQRHLRAKLQNYWRAYNEVDVNVMPVYPRIVWVGVDAERAKELAWVVAQGPKDAQALFSVVTRETLANLFIG